MLKAFSVSSNAAPSPPEDKGKETGGSSHARTAISRAGCLLSRARGQKQKVIRFASLAGGDKTLPEV